MFNLVFTMRSICTQYLVGLVLLGTSVRLFFEQQAAIFRSCLNNTSGKAYDYNEYCQHDSIYGKYSKVVSFEIFKQEADT